MRGKVVGRLVERKGQEEGGRRDGTKHAYIRSTNWLIKVNKFLKIGPELDKIKVPESTT